MGKYSQVIKFMNLISVNYYSPSGLTYATDEKLRALLDDMKMWRERLPDELKFRGPSSPRSAGELAALLCSKSELISNLVIAKQCHQASCIFSIRQCR